MGLFDVVSGAVTGFASGGPAGGVLGGVAGLLGGGSGNRTTNESTGLAVRPFSATEQSIVSNIERALANLTANRGGDTSKREDAIFQEQYAPAAKAISDAYMVKGGQIDAANLRRGGGLSSKMGADQLAIKGQMAGSLAGAAADARSVARNAVLAETDASRADMQALGSLMSTLYNNRVTGQTRTSVATNTYGIDATTGLGVAAANPNSWLNTNGLPSAWRGISSLFGGGDNKNIGSIR